MIMVHFDYDRISHEDLCHHGLASRHWLPGVNEGMCPRTPLGSVFAGPCPGLDPCTGGTDPRSPSAARGTREFPPPRTPPGGSSSEQCLSPSLQSLPQLLATLHVCLVGGYCWF